MQENSGLGNIRFFQVFFGAVEHDIGNAESQKVVRLFKKLFCKTLFS